MIGYILRRLAATVAGDAHRRGARVPDAAPHAGRSGRHHRGRQRQRRAGRADPQRGSASTSRSSTQFLIWLGNILRGDFGDSFFFKKPVAELIAQRLEPTLALVVADHHHRGRRRGAARRARRLQARQLDRPHRHGLLGARLLGAGVRDRLSRSSTLRHQAQLAAGAGLSAASRDGFGGFLQRLILPSLTLSVIYIALIARMTRTSVLDVMGEDYIRTARAKGQAEMQGAVPPCAEERRGADRHGDRARRRAADRRRGGDRERVHHPGPRPAHRRRGAGARLSDHPGA